VVEVVVVETTCKEGRCTIMGWDGKYQLRGAVAAAVGEGPGCGRSSSSRRRRRTYRHNGLRYHMLLQEFRKL